MEIKKKNVKFSIIVYSTLIILAIIILVSGFLIYEAGMNNGFTQKVTRLIHFPAAVINSRDFVTISEFNADLNSVRRFYENQDFSETGLRVDFTTEDGQKRLKIKEKNLLNKMIENRIISKLAEGRGIKITEEMVAQEVDRKINEYGTRDLVLKNLQNLYGWDLEKFQEKIVKPDLYKEALEKSVRESDQNITEAKNKITAALGELQSKKDFVEVVKKYSDGDSAKNGGELGWLTTDQMIPEISMATVQLKKGEESGIVESPLGFHIVDVEDKKTEDGTDKIRIRQIFVRSKNFSDWLLEQEKNFKIYIPLKDYYWDNSSQSVQFSKPELRDFEDNLEKNSPDDISIMF